jgi:flagellar protein FliS
MSHREYQRQAVETAGPAQLITMLYDGALAAIGLAESAIIDLRHADAHTQLVKAQDIVAELWSCLDMERGGSVAVSLATLYEFCHHCLVEANLAKSTPPLKGVAQVLSELRGAWSSLEAS